MDTIALARELMHNQTKKNKAPVWELTELAIQKGIELAAIYKVNKKLVTLSLYLAHTVFDQEIGGPIQKNHEAMSAQFVLKYLHKRGISTKDQEIIINAIQAHHHKIPTNSKIAEVVKNAECFKFVTVEGSLIWFHELGIRQVPLQEALDLVFKKADQKMALLTLPDCIRQAKKNYVLIKKLFSPLQTNKTRAR